MRIICKNIHFDVFWLYNSGVSLFRVTFAASPVIGGKGSGGSWSGIFGMLKRCEVNLVGFDTVMTSDRSEVANVLTPFFDAK